MRKARAIAIARPLVFGTVDSGLEILRVLLVTASAMALIMAGQHWPF
jgi:hypothetical protein